MTKNDEDVSSVGVVDARRRGALFILLLSLQNNSLSGTKSCLEISAVKQSMMPFITAHIFNLVHK